MREFLLLCLIVVAGTGGELCVTRAMKQIGEVTDFRPAALVRFILRALTVAWMWIGIAMMTVAFFALFGGVVLRECEFCGSRYCPQLRSRRSRRDAIPAGTDQRAAMDRRVDRVRWCDHCAA